MKKQLIMSMLLLCCTSLFGQVKEIKARLVIQGTQIPIAFQEIRVSNGFDYVTYSDGNGNFLIPASDSSYLITIIREEYNEFMLNITSDMPEFNIELSRKLHVSEDLSTLIDNITKNMIYMDEVVVESNYRSRLIEHMKKSVYGGSTVFIDPIKASATLNIVNLLRVVPGVQVYGEDVIIRGAGSVNSSTKPLIILDGILYTGELSDILPSDVFSVSVLKGAETSIYGMKGANGVLYITTNAWVNSKRGRR